MNGPRGDCAACGVVLPDPPPRWCPACGTEIERRSADRPPASAWRRRRIALIATAVVVAGLIAGAVALLSDPATDDGPDRDAASRLVGPTGTSVPSTGPVLVGGPIGATVIDARPERTR